MKGTTTESNGSGGSAGIGQATRERERQTVFEFTKRRKYLDILISEAPDSIMLILNPQRKVLYTGPAVVDLLGWQPEKLVDRDILEFINNDDSQSFADNFQDAVTARQKLVTYVRLKCKGDLGHTSRINSGECVAKELLFEITGRPLQEQDELGCRLYFMVAKPYPSRNTAIMNTFLELKIENERLTRYLKERSLELAQVTGGSNLSTLSIASGQMHSYSSNSVPYNLSGLRQDGGASGGNTSMTPSFVQSTYSPTYEDTGTDDGGIKRRLKKVPGSDPQHVCVTCGRTSSPEWRKGPMGPKTLCNACGLRWAKRSKKTDEVPTTSNNTSSPTPKLPPSSNDGRIATPSIAGTSINSAATALVSSHDRPSHNLMSSSSITIPSYQHLQIISPPMQISTNAYHANLAAMAPLHSPTAISPSHHYPQQQHSPQSYAPPPYPPGGHELTGQGVWTSQTHGHHQTSGRYTQY